MPRIDVLDAAVRDRGPSPKEDAVLNEQVVVSNNVTEGVVLQCGPEQSEHNVHGDERDHGDKNQIGSNG